ncbi:caspase family protein [Reichenbachiella agariperforans]|uniref:caspase family protein n=1 Tax=Reichenbachiella agariperforans TaxID=156994 RepID=UPI001C0A50A3|nr:caspase family protein [Reichenbachiella agariperforans]MBU2913846.1 caspase family protein [Reichenbachiella agariperforans]
MKSRILVLLFILVSIVCSLRAQDLALRTVVQRGHEGTILCAAFSPDDQWVVTGSADQTAIIWDSQTGRQLRTLSGHTKGVTAVSFHPTDQVVATAGNDGRVILWDMITGENIQEIDWQKWISSIAFSPDGKSILIGGGQYVVQLIQLDDPKQITPYKVDKTQYGVQVAFDPLSGHVLTGNDDGKLIKYELETGAPLDTLRNITASSCGGCLTYFDQNEQNQELVSVARAGALSLWDMKGMRLIKTYGESDNDYLSVALSSNSVYACDEHQIEAWDKEKGTKKVLGESGEKLVGIVLSSDDTRLMSFGEDRVARIWEATSGRQIATLSGYLNAENDRGLAFSRNSYWHSNVNKFISIQNRVKISPDGKTMIKGHNNHEAYLWDTEGGRVKLELKGHDKVVVDYAFTPDSKYVYTAGGDRVIRLWDVTTGKELRSFEGHIDLIFTLVLSDDGRYLVSGSWDGSAILWDTATGERINQYRFSNSSPFSLAFAYRDQYLLVGGLGQQLQLIEIDTGTPVMDYIGHQDVVTDIEVKGEEFLTASLDGRIKRWELKTGFQSQKYIGHEGAVYDVCYDSHGQYLLSGGTDRIVRLWDLKSGKELKQLIGHKGAITGVAFIHDDRVIVSSSLDGTTRYWDVESGNEIASHVFLGPNDWLTKSVNGYFDATEGAKQNIFFVRGLESFTLDQFFEDFYRPDILGESLRLGASFHYDSDLKKKLQDSPPPKVELVSPKAGEKMTDRDIDVVVKVTNGGGGMDEIRVLHNGKRIMGKERGLSMEEKSKRTIYKHVPVRLVSGKNVLSVSAFSEERIESSVVEQEVYYEGETEKITCHVVTIGINTYKNPILNLNYAKEDAEGFQDLIKKKGKELYDELVYYPLYDEEASKENILSLLDQVADRAKPEDVLLFYYAGHGSTVEGDFYFIPTENVRLYDQKKLKSHAIYAGEIQQKLANIAALKQMVVLDACQSGSSTQLLASRGAEEEKALAQLSRSTGVHILAASGSEQYATEFAELGHGLFTYVLLEALQGKADGAPHDGKVTIYELKSYLDDQVPEYSIQFKGKPQFPVTYSRGQDFPIVVD